MGAVGLVMFLTFVGFSSSQFHGWLFQNRGVSKLDIGLLLMAGQAAAVISPFFQVSSIRLFHGPRIPFLLVLAGTGAGLAALPHATGFWPLFACFTLFSFCAAGVFPLNAANAFESLRARGHGAFFRIRSLGTLGFLAGCVLSVCFPQVRDLPLLYAGFAGSLFLAMGISAWGLRRGKEAHVGEPPKRPTFTHGLKLLGQPRTLRLLTVLGIMNFANSMATGVQGNYLVERWHQDQRVISLAWVVSTACEVPLMLFCAWLLRRKGLRAVLAFGIGGTFLKLTGLALAGEAWQYCLALALHGCFFSGALTGFTVWVDRVYKFQDRPSLQALAPIFYAGIPSALAGLTAGLVWQNQSLRAVYLLAGAVSAAAAVYAFILLRDKDGTGGDAPMP